MRSNVKIWNIDSLHLTDDDQILRTSWLSKYSSNESKFVDIVPQSTFQPYQRCSDFAGLFRLTLFLVLIFYEDHMPRQEGYLFLEVF
jgi:hypothetical protein